MTDDNLYLIEKILDRRKANNRLEYKIKWEGYPMNQSTWEPIENLKTAIELVIEYDQLHPITQNKKVSQTKKFLGKKKKPPKQKKKVNLKILEKKPESMQEKKKVENINIDEGDKQAFTIIPQDEYKKKYIIDDSLKSVITVRKKDNKLVAAVEKMKENGIMEKIEIETSKLKNDNPWILLDFYESKIKFT